MVYKFFGKKFSSANTSAGAITSVPPETIDRQDKSDIENKIISDQQLAEELHKPFFRKFKKRKVHSPSIDNSWGDDLVDKQF